MGGERASTARARLAGRNCWRCGTLLADPPPTRPAGMRDSERACPACEPRPYRVQMNFDHYPAGYRVQFLRAMAPSQHCNTPVNARRYAFPTGEALRCFVVRTRPSAETLADFDLSLRAWGRGSNYLQLTEREWLLLVNHR